PCPVYVRTVTANNAQPLTPPQCLPPLLPFRVPSSSNTPPHAKSSPLCSF
ncbi:YjeJ family protein, partial [Escherichia coli]